MLVLLVLIAIASVGCSTSQAREYAQSRVLWQKADPECFPAGKPLQEQMREFGKQPREGDWEPPRKTSFGDIPSTGIVEGMENVETFPVIELIINSNGEVESVVSIQQTTQKLDDLLASLASKWEFDSAKSGGKPVCSQYRVVVRDNWQTPKNQS